MTAPIHLDAPQPKIMVGAHIPGVNRPHEIAVADLPGHKASGRAFHDSEANCNFCARLERVKMPKSADGFLHGRCDADVSQRMASPYFSRQDDWSDVMAFHPDDPMNMPCYVSRWGATS